ncbi:hypothetical protein JHK82_052755 [Glycine max]|uniref:RNase H type-1 domain-containing protein n=2 Tax=Glycine subgen. Soja TaxID=1462606 RepID=A0A0R0EUL0_SOYBN|nr:hypothetical protein JHK86_052602 [Glycine max]KAG4915138.1 hypothetical protein JHK87_052695 [Glycine soja]KAG4926968.1 hypothetical protein JHK85_053454 [Glycine max]KAG5082600.1 hypothetical protein JHK84_052638 [Glycine max]KAG5085358.1 hypothetical protein JHK82_052755 [Glycine max]
MASAYYSLINSDGMVSDPIYQLVWSWRGPERNCGADIESSDHIFLHCALDGDGENHSIAIPTCAQRSHTSNYNNWEQPPLGQLMLINIDSVVDLFVNKATVGVVATELWAILIGIQVALGAGFRSFIVETDSQTSINLIHDCQASHPCFSLVLSIKKFAAKRMYLRSCFSERSYSTRA